MALSVSEDEAARIVQGAVREAYGAMYAYVNRKLAEGATVDAAFMQSTQLSLEQISAQYGSEIVEARLADILAQAAMDGAEDTGVKGALGLLDMTAVDIALHNAEVHIKDITDAGVKVVSETITNAMITGKSLTETSELLRVGLLENGLDIAEARADMIARNETFSVYRQAGKSVADAVGATSFKLSGPVDDRTSEICLEYVGKTMTQDDWEAVEPLAFVYGLHVNCRHTLEPVLND